jgi:hypothetical protein
MSYTKGGTQYYTVKIERYTLQGLQEGGLPECDICGVQFELSVFTDPEFHKGCDLTQVLLGIPTNQPPMKDR